MSETAGTGMETVQALVRMLSGAEVTVDGVAAALGTVTEAREGDDPACIQPNNRAFGEGHVVPGIGTEEPANVSLQLAEPDAITVKELEAVFGPFREAMPLGWGRPTELIFNADLSDQPKGCSVIVRVVEGPNGVVDGEITEVIVQREIRLD